MYSKFIVIFGFLAYSLNSLPLYACSEYGDNSDIQYGDLFKREKGFFSSSRFTDIKTKSTNNISNYLNLKYGEGRWEFDPDGKKMRAIHRYDNKSAAPHDPRVTVVLRNGVDQQIEIFREIYKQYPVPGSFEPITRHAQITTKGENDSFIDVSITVGQRYAHFLNIWAVLISDNKLPVLSPLISFKRGTCGAGWIAFGINEKNAEKNTIKKIGD